MLLFILFSLLLSLICTKRKREGESEGGERRRIRKEEEKRWKGMSVSGKFFYPVFSFLPVRGKKKKKNEREERVKREKCQS